MIRVFHALNKIISEKLFVVIKEIIMIPPVGSARLTAAWTSREQFQPSTHAKESWLLIIYSALVEGAALMRELLIKIVKRIL